MPKDFFISYTNADLKWAEWIAWQLEEAGYEVIIQAWDAKAGQDSVEWMNKALEDYQQIIGVFSSAYLANEVRFSKMELNTAIYEEKLIPVRIEAVELKGLLSRITRIDLFDLSEEKAKQKLLQDVDLKRKKPPAAPVFPGSATHTVTMPKCFPGTLPSVWNLPHLRNPNFTGRENIFTELDKALNSGQSAVLIQAITGLGGIGKTQIALEYAYRYAADYDIIWWLRAEEPETLTVDYAALASALDLPQKALTEQVVIIPAVRTWLEQHSGWLLIFDNSERPEDLVEYLPKASTGHILITSRNPHWHRIANSLNIEVWDRADSIEYLLNRTGQTDRFLAKNIAEALGDLPLAIEQAASYISETPVLLSEYWRLLKSRHTELWEEGSPLLDYPHTVATTWSLSIEKVKEQIPAGAYILSFYAFLAPDNIPRWFLNELVKHDIPNQLAEMLENPLTINKCIKILAHYSLIKATPESVSIHRLIQAVIRRQLSVDEQNLWAKIAVSFIKHRFPSESYNIESWPKCNDLLPHALATIKHAEDREVALKKASSLLNYAASYLENRAEYTRAEALLRRALAIVQDIYGKNSIEAAWSYYEVGMVLWKLSEYAEAESLVRRSLKIVTKKYGENHPDTATIASGLASVLLYAAGMNPDSEIESLERKSLEIKIKEYDNEYDPRLATPYNNFAELLHAMGKYKEAENFYRKALKIYKTRGKKGDARLGLANSADNLGGLFDTMGNYVKAEKQYRRALKICQAELGKDHPDTKDVKNHLILALLNQDKYGEAEPFIRKVLNEKAQTGEYRIEMGNSFFEIGAFFHTHDKLSKAEKFYRKALEIYQARIGEDHPDTIKVKEALNRL